MPLVASGALGEGFVEHPLSQRPHESGLFGQWQELERGYQPECCVGPANEGFDGENLAGLEIQLGLVVQHEVAVLHRFAKFVEQVGRVLTAVEFVIVEDVGHLAELGAVHRHVGAPHQPGPSMRSTARGRCRCSLRPRLERVEVEGLFDLAHDPLGDHDRDVGVGVDEDDGQFVAPEAHDGTGLHPLRASGAGRAGATVRRPRGVRRSR